MKFHASFFDIAFFAISLMLAFVESPWWLIVSAAQFMLFFYEERSNKLFTVSWKKGRGWRFDK